VECLSEKHLRFARKGFVIYLTAIGISVFLIAWVGNQLLSGKGIDNDTYVLALPVMNNNPWLGLFALIGGFSASTRPFASRTAARTPSVSAREKRQ
jgi:hypothetical protein